MTLAELYDLMTRMRSLGVASVTHEGTQVILGPEPAQKREALPAAEPKSPPIGPDGKPMSEYDRVLFQHTLGDEGDLQ